jgi:hypothetical protein
MQGGLQALVHPAETLEKGYYELIGTHLNGLDAAVARRKPVRRLAGVVRAISLGYYLFP